MFRFLVALPFVLPATLATAQDAIYDCEGSSPKWVLTLLDNQAQFLFADRTIDFEIPQITVAEGQDDPLAYTLLSDADTAIVLLEEESCIAPGREASHEVQILTQRRGLPILLSGCCQVRE